MRLYFIFYFDSNPLVQACNICSTTEWIYFPLFKGPREDAGLSSAIVPGQRLVFALYDHCKKYHPKTQVMVSGVRTKEGKQMDFEDNCNLLTDCTILVTLSNIFGLYHRL